MLTFQRQVSVFALKTLLLKVVGLTLSTPNEQGGLLGGQQILRPSNRFSRSYT